MITSQCIGLGEIGLDFVRTQPSVIQSLINGFYNRLYCLTHNLRGAGDVLVKDFETYSDSVVDAKPFVLAWLLNIRRALSFLETRIDLSNYIFCDVGCGTGISTIYANSYQFSSVVGFDFQKSFVSIANSILDRGRRIDKKITFLEADAVNFKISPATILFLFNPFGPETLHKFIVNNSDELRRGDTWAILLNDRLINSFLETTHFELVRRDYKYNISILKSLKASNH